MTKAELDEIKDFLRFGALECEDEDCFRFEVEQNLQRLINEIERCWVELENKRITKEIERYWVELENKTI